MDAQDWLAMTNVESRIIKINYYPVAKDKNVRGKLLGHGKALIVENRGAEKQPVPPEDA